ncbi:hypothetical protein ACIA5G_04360 [Amycolatopsis sp. NPDC051758]|uniref:hypothetical protein n=1 Tax=Amycolatopsis sp. NPDC051758 TaxID=3363935 RepID=UPI0037ACA539
MNKKLVGSAVIGAAVLAIVVAQFWRGEEAPAAAPPPPSTSMPTTTTVPLKGEFVAYQFPDAAGGRGWSLQIPVPAGWAATDDKDRATYRRGDVVLEIDRVPLDQEDPMSGLVALDKKSATFPGHSPGTVSPHDPVGGYDAAKWEFRYERDGVTRQVREIGIGVGEALVTIRYDAPVAQFTDNVEVLADALQVTGAG